MNFATTLKADSEMRCGQRNEPYFQKYISSLKNAYFSLYSILHLLQLLIENNLFEFKMF